MELVEFLTARLNEDEQAALAATWDADASRRWNPHLIEKPRWGWGVVDDMDAGVTVVEPAAADAAAVAQHMARHDPARVLRDVAAKRRLVEYIEEELTNQGNSNNDKLMHVLRLSALSYASHRDYDEAWRP
ncbi:DUF6221 family protein [Streptomyces zaomyceticus]|uniref:DUF6221 family protein n=1 Tax=Streptomyces zaomyceticus TaxID=68286 RepID=UPI0037B05113